MNKLTTIQKAYIAGFTDGEGCISITKYKNTHQSTFRIVNTNKEVLDYLCTIVGIGSISPFAINRKDYRNKNAKPLWARHFSANGMREFLPEILPYLIVKKRVAELALELLQSKLARGRHVTYEEKCRREQIYIQLSELNHRGL